MTDYYISENDLQTYNDYFDDYTLEHHGILGMKWGRKMGPPYPLDASDHSASEKKAGWRQSLDNAANKIHSATEKLKEEFSGKKSSGSSETAKQEPPKNETPEEKEAREKAERRAVIDSANANTIAANASKLSTQELQEAVNRMNLMAQVNAKTTTPPTTMDKINAGIDKLDKAATTVTKGVDTYNKVAKLYNKFGDPPLPVLDKSLEERRKAAADEDKKVKEEARKEVINAALRSGDPDRIMKAMHELKMNPSEIGDANKTLNNVLNMQRLSKEKADAPRKEAEAKAKAEQEKKEKERKAAEEAEKKEIERIEAFNKSTEEILKREKEEAARAKAAEEAEKKSEREAKAAKEKAKEEAAARARTERIEVATKARDFEYFAKNNDDLTTTEMKNAQSEIQAREEFNRYVSEMNKKKRNILL